MNNAKLWPSVCVMCASVLSYGWYVGVNVCGFERGGERVCNCCVNFGQV